MVKSTVRYLENLRCELVHEASQAKIRTDAPIDNQGEGALFSPTDLVGAALSSCIITTIGIVAKQKGFSISTAHGSLEKEMTPAPRRIASLKLELHFPMALTEEERATVERTARHCPVHRSLHPDIQIPIQFLYDLN
ncbi:MAG: osmotically inducible protein OsmC [Deltaproteobacteria bacterium CG11_big_fil_rev_8_21_14_0_20_45_16]|nr:MAG: osmotically inducible protein OsmC [Deltaproteobacteria bacterium CG11_big_fil_rev_8_21_14_0_20_45_16]